MGMANDNAAAGFATLRHRHPVSRRARRDRRSTSRTRSARHGARRLAGGQRRAVHAVLRRDRQQDLKIPPFLPKAVRDAFMQAAFDCMQEARLVGVGDISAITAKEPRLAMLSLRHDALAYSGESFGSIIGSITVAIEPTIGAASLDVGGGGLLFPLLLNTNEYGPKIAPFLDGALGTQTADPDDPTETDFAYNLAQYLLEQGDAGAYAPYVAAAPDRHATRPSTCCSRRRTSTRRCPTRPTCSSRAAWAFCRSTCRRVARSI